MQRVVLRGVATPDPSNLYSAPESRLSEPLNLRKEGLLQQLCILLQPLIGKNYSYACFELCFCRRTSFVYPRHFCRWGNAANFCFPQ